jgi:vancomycin resistance protein YoaR
MRRPISELHPILHDLRVAELCLERRISDRIRRVRFASEVRAQHPAVILVRHASVLRRALRDLDPALQESKITNLRLASAAIDGLVIRPGETFSFWNRVGPPIGVNHALVAYAVDDALLDPRSTSTTRSTAASLAADGGLRARRPAS